MNHARPSPNPSLWATFTQYRARRAVSPGAAKLAAILNSRGNPSWGMCRPRSGPVRPSAQPWSARPGRCCAERPIWRAGAQALGHLEPSGARPGGPFPASASLVQLPPSPRRPGQWQRGPWAKSGASRTPVSRQLFGPQPDERPVQRLGAARSWRSNAAGLPAQSPRLPRTLARHLLKKAAQDHSPVG